MKFIHLCYGVACTLLLILSIILFKLTFELSVIFGIVTVLFMFFPISYFVKEMLKDFKKYGDHQECKRERDQLRAIVNLDIRSFVLLQNREEFEKRLNYLRKCMNHYRFQKK